MLDYQTQRRIELFLFEEAKLLDSGEFEAWLKLYEPHGIYWMPSQRGQTDPVNVASIIYEDHAILSMRVQRLLEARALVLTPMHRTPRISSATSRPRRPAGRNSPRMRRSSASSIRPRSRISIRAAARTSSCAKAKRSASPRSASTC